MNILYIGSLAKGSTARHRADALERLGHQVIKLDPRQLLKSQMQNRWFSICHFRTGYRLIQGPLRKRIAGLDILETDRPFDLAWINSGEHFGPRIIRQLKNFARKTVLYVNDDPTGGRDGRRFDQLLKALPEYDLCVVCREPNVKEFKALGAKRVHRVFMSYDEQVHRPPASDEAGRPISSDVAFIGTCMEDRDKFLGSLARMGVPLTVWGSRWRQSRNLDCLEHCLKDGVLLDRDYVRAIAGAKVSIGLLSKRNRDLHTSRSVEIPYAGGVLCAERTSEHTEMFRDGEEAVFWKTPEECARLCRELLRHEDWRERIREAGHRRVRQLKVGNEDICRDILATLGTQVSARAVDSLQTEIP